MPDRADAHMHLFEHGFRGSFTHRPGVQIDEVALYASLAADHGVRRALVVCFEGEPWAAGNNAFVAGLAERHDWVKPAAFVHLDGPPDVDALEALRRRGFVGISLYVLNDKAVAGLKTIPDAVWSWLTERRWLVSCNSVGRLLPAWQPILKKHQPLRLVLSHLALPPKAKQPVSPAEAESALAGQLSLADFPGVHIKLSGFYALSDPGYGYPHTPAWGYVEALKAGFGVERLVWGSDFAPCLDAITFPQTLGLFGQMPFLNDTDRAAIEGGNLLKFLADVRA